MVAHFTSESQRRLFSRVTSALASIGYRGDLLETEYKYLDYLSPTTPQREIDAACFGRVPADYETALLGITVANGISGRALINAHRALCSPLILEVGSETVGIWTVGQSERDTSRTKELDGESFSNWVAGNAHLLNPKEFLRTKNIRQGEPRLYQRSLFAGLIPELEERISEILEPRLIGAFEAGLKTYKDETGRVAPEATLFKLAFWILTGKVFFDRRHKDFVSLGNSPTPDDVVARVGEHYKEPAGRLLTDSTRQSVFDHIWTKMDFRNLSVEVLSQIWSRTLVTKETRDRLGIHRTPHSIVKYIVDRMPLDPLPKTNELVVEPCCGSAVFLVAALNRMRDVLGQEMSAKERHKYFTQVLRGFEKDPFGAEIGRLCLALSDYPNANGWKVEPADVLRSKSFPETIESASIVLCNPPYGTFNDEEREEYAGHSIHRPVAILNRVLDSLSANGVLGFVLPRVFIDSPGYKNARERVANRFANVELLTLPDKGWEFADQETVLLIATEPQSKTNRVRLTHRKVRENGWQDFDWFHKVSSEDSKEVQPAEARESFALPELRKLWVHLKRHTTIGDVAEGHRGIQWNKDLTKDGVETGWREKLIQRKKFPNSRRGIPPTPRSIYSKEQRAIYSFSEPKTLAWLDVSDEHRNRNAHDYPWEKPKVILNAITKSRGKWRIAAFADTDGLVCYQNLTAVWPKNEDDLLVLTAVLNSPLANAYATTHEGKKHLTVETILSVPMPRIDAKLRTDIACLVGSYLAELNDDKFLLGSDCDAKADAALRKIDARILKAYGLTPRQERELLDYFNNDWIEYGRQVPFRFTNYFPDDLESYFTLDEYLSTKMRRSTIDRLLKTPKPPPSVIDALNCAAEMHSK